MNTSAGLLLIYNNKILLCHPTNSPWNGTFSIPKGGIEDFDEDKIDTAIRETKEEVGINIDRKQIDETNEKVIIYKNKKGKAYKKVYYYPVYLKEKIKIEKNKLQLDEVDYADFLDKQEAEEKIFWRFLEMLDFIDY
jgi:ADP-ribose pyrophosphatase YjhB (NUDIX family)